MKNKIKTKIYCACNKRPCEGICREINLKKRKNSGLPDDRCIAAYEVVDE